MLGWGLGFCQEEAEEQRMTALKLLAELSFTLGPETVKTQVSPQVTAKQTQPETVNDKHTTRFLNPIP